MADRWDLTALFNAADPKAEAVERHLWMIRLVQWLRRAPLPAGAGAARIASAAVERRDDAAVGRAIVESAAAGVEVAADRVAALPDPRDAAPPRPLVRLRHLLGVLERNPEVRVRVATLLRLFLREVDGAALLADFGFAPRSGLMAEFGRRLRARLLPLTPATTDLGELFTLLFSDRRDVVWLRALDDATIARIARLLQAAALPEALPGRDWRAPFHDAITFLASAIRAAGFSPAMRRRMDPALLAEQPFHQLARTAERARELAESGDPADHARFVQEARYLRAVLDRCRGAADSVLAHLEQHGVSVDVVFEVDQLRERAHRIDTLLNCVLADAPRREIANLVVELAVAAEERRSIRALFAQHYSLLARKVAERSAATGEHYIARTPQQYRAMLGTALGGGLVLAGTTFAKFAILAIGLTAFWAGLAAGVNYALSFVLIHVLGFTVATKQPAMTAPTMAARLGDVASDEAVERFVDEVAHLIRSQVAGIIGNVAAVVPAVLVAQWAATRWLGHPLVGAKQAEHVLHDLTLLGPTALYAAFTGVLLFGSSLMAGWCENWFVWHRLDSAISWNPTFVARLGAARAKRWGHWWRHHVSALASNISLGLMLGLVPAVALFFAIPLDVRHVTLASGQLAAAVGALGWATTHTPAFWWCVGGVVATGALNLAVSFLLAFRVALRSRSIRVADRGRIHRAIRARLWRAPLSFVWPGRAGVANAA